MNSLFKSVLKFYSKVLFTNRCELCGEVIEFDENLCDECKNVSVISKPLCEFCGCSKKDCTCKKHKNEFKQVIAPYYYENSVSRAIHNFKENDMPFLSKRLSLDMYKTVEDVYANIKFDYVTFVPFRRFHQSFRGYNQSQLLAKRIADKMNIPCVELLKKVRNTGVQHKKTEKQRKADIFGAFDVKDEYKDKLESKVILLVDDVKTTGSTLNECSKMLKIYSASAVYCVTAAITKRDKIDEKKQ